MYDQLVVMAPIMMAMTAGTPIFKVIIGTCLYEYYLTSGGRKWSVGSPVGY